MDVRWASNYHDVLALAPGDWHAVVVDLLVPRGERYAICREIRATFGLPVIFADDRPDALLGGNLGADLYLDKPLTAESIWVSLHGVKIRQQTSADAVHAAKL
jgi:DNA-binding response OmpR family regulator